MSMCRPRVSNVYVFSRFLWVFTRKVKYVRPCPVKFPHFYFLAWRFERFSNKKHYSSPLHYFQKWQNGFIYDSSFSFHCFCTSVREGVWSWIISMSGATAVQSSKHGTMWWCTWGKCGKDHTTNNVYSVCVWICVQSNMHTSASALEMHYAFYCFFSLLTIILSGKYPWTKELEVFKKLCSATYIILIYVD